MCKELEEELKRGDEAGKALAVHLLAMGGASMINCVEIGGKRINFAVWHEGAKVDLVEELEKRQEAFLDEARQAAAQCWCDPATSSKVMDPELYEAFAKRLANWMETAASYSRNAEYMRGILQEVFEQLPDDMKRKACHCDDGTFAPEPFFSSLPEVVHTMVKSSA